MPGTFFCEFDFMTTRVLMGLHAQIFEAAKQRASREFAMTSIDLTMATASDYDLYLPLTLTDYDALRTSGLDAFLDLAIVPTPSAVEACDDKLVFAELVEQAGLEQYVPRRVGLLASCPYVLKKRRDAFGRGTSVITTDPADIERAERLGSADYFAQELVAGATEFATHMLLSRGRLLHHFTARFQMTSDRTIKGIASSGTYAGSYDATPHLAVFEKMLTVVGFFDGVCCFDYKIVDGQPRVFEINPRFGGSLTMDMTAFLQAYRGAVQTKRLASACV